MELVLILILSIVGMMQEYKISKLEEELEKNKCVLGSVIAKVFLGKDVKNVNLEIIEKSSDKE